VLVIIALSLLNERVLRRKPSVAASVAAKGPAIGVYVPDRPCERYRHASGGDCNLLPSGGRGALRRGPHALSRPACAH
jgi:hypothetical protein